MDAEVRFTSNETEPICLTHHGQLRKLGNKARALGRSAGILAASTRLRERLGRVLYLFRKNAEELYPEGIREHIIANRTPVKHVRRWKAKNFLDPTIKIQAPLQDNSDSTHDSLAQEFWQFSRDVITLFECFGQYPEFLEELPDFSIAEDLQVCAIYNHSTSSALYRRKLCRCGPTHCWRTLKVSINESLYYMDVDGVSR